MASLMDLTMLLFFACTTSPASVAKELLAAVPLAVALCRAAVCLVATQVLLITTMIVERQVPWVMLLGEHRVWLVLVEMAWIVSVGTVGRILRCLIVLMLHLVGLLIKLHGRAAEFFLCIDVVFVAVAVHAIIKVVFFNSFFVPVSLLSPFVWCKETCWNKSLYPNFRKKIDCT